MTTTTQTTHQPWLRTTPKRYQCQDPLLFPSHFEKIQPLPCRRYRVNFVPKYFYLHVKPTRVTFTLDAFFLPPDFEQRFAELYQAYVAWWLEKNNPARKLFPRAGIFLMLRDFVSITVLREHAAWWRQLFEELLPYCYNPWDEEIRLHEWRTTHGIEANVGVA